MREMKDSGISLVGKIPQNWEIKRLKYLFKFCKGLPITKDNLIDQGLPVISYGQIHAKTNNGVDVLPHLLRFVDFSYQTFYPLSQVMRGDFVFADTSEDYDGCGNCVYKRNDSLLFAGYHTIIAHSIIESDNRFFAYLFLTDLWRRQIREKVSGVKVFSITQKTLSNSYIVLPPLTEQQRIAEFLDREGGKIDGLKADIQAQIDTLEQYKRSVITEAVTHGLNPSAPMKDSGIPWVGEIPQNRVKAKIKNVASMISSGTTPLSAVSEFFENGTINWIQSGDIYGKKYINDVSMKITELALASSSSLKIVRKPFIVMAMYGGSVGNTAISLIDACTNQACCCIKPNDKTNFGFLYYWLLFCREDFLIKAEGGGQPNISQNKIRNEYIFIPPLDEQQEIADYLDNKCTEIEQIIADKKTQIETLDGYKKSLIYECVTGKKEIV